MRAGSGPPGGSALARLKMGLRLGAACLEGQDMHAGLGTSPVQIGGGESAMLWSQGGNPWDGPGLRRPTHATSGGPASAGPGTFRTQGQDGGGEAGMVKLYEPSPTQCLYVAQAPAENIVGRAPLMPLFLAGSTAPTIPHLYSKRKDSGFPMGCTDAAAVDGRRGSNVYEVNPWLWQFGRGKPRLAD